MLSCDPASVSELPGGRCVAFLKLQQAQRSVDEDCNSSFYTLIDKQRAGKAIRSCGWRKARPLRSVKPAQIAATFSTFFRLARTRHTMKATTRLTCVLVISFCFFIVELAGALLAPRAWSHRS